MKLRAVLVPFLSSMLWGCSSGTVPSDGAESASLSLTALPVAVASSAAARAEIGGKLLLELGNPTLPLVREDSLAWDGGDSLNASFADLPASEGYRLVARYRDARGIVTHRDSGTIFGLGHAEARSMRLRLGVVLGKILLQFPSVPETVDSLGIAASVGGRSWSAVSVRLSGGKALLRLDSLPLGSALDVHLRAWNAARDTLFFLDTSLTLSSSDDVVYAWNFATSLARVSAGISFALGGEASVQVGFPAGGSPALQDGRLLFAGFSDSGRSDWVRLVNPGADTFVGKVRLARGATDTLLRLRIAPGGELFLTTAGGELLAAAGHPLAGLPTLPTGIASVTWATAGGTVWKLSDSAGTLLHDLVYVTPGKNGWPSLSASGNRTALVRPSGRSALGNDAGSRWCGLAEDTPSSPCTD